MALSARYQNALVTGASSGLGAAFVGMLLEQGLRVWGTSRDSTRLHRREGFEPLEMELGDPASIERAWAEAEAKSGGIDLLINNAGSGVFAPFTRVGTEQLEAQLRLLALGPARLLRLAALAMHRRGRGCLVNVTSLAVEMPIPFLSGYNAGKAALAALSASLELETAGRELIVLDFRPGDYRTNFNQMMAPSADLLSAEPACEAVWQRCELLMAESPPPRRAADDLRRALERGRSGVVRSGSLFQAVVAAGAAAIAPVRWLRHWQRRYYRLAP